MGQVTSIHNKILATKAQPSTELNSHQLDLLAAKVCAETGIKELPSIEVIDLCMKSWVEKFSVKMNSQELHLAFEMNINGDLSKKVEHYQCFSRDYFCSVLLLYLEQKEIANKKAVEKAEHIAGVDTEKYLQGLVGAIEQDILNVAAGLPLTTSHTLKLKFTHISKGIEFTDAEVSKAREAGKHEFMSELNRSKTEALRRKSDTALGLQHQYVRIKDNKLITENDESQIQYYAMKFLYHDLLTKRNSKK